MRCFLTIDDVRPLVPDAAHLTRLDGGTVKGVYRVTRADGTTVLIYRWHADENFWPTQIGIDVGPFAVEQGRRETFLSRHALLESVGARVPHLLGLDGEDLAVIEDVRGGTLERSPRPETFARLREMLLRMHSQRLPLDFRPEDVLLERGLRSLVEAAARVPAIAAVEDRLRYELSARHAAVTPRAEQGVIHGELGPDHVMVDDDGEPVLIDIESAMVFDVEWEHAFLELRHEANYPLLHTVDLDEPRLSLSRLVQYLSLVAGPLMLVDGDFPRADGMRQIAAWNTERVLSVLPVLQRTAGGSPAGRGVGGESTPDVRVVGHQRDGLVLAGRVQQHDPAHRRVLPARRDDQAAVLEAFEPLHVRGAGVVDLGQGCGVGGDHQIHGHSVGQVRQFLDERLGVGPRCPWYREP